MQQITPPEPITTPPLHRGDPRGSNGGNRIRKRHPFGKIRMPRRCIGAVVVHAALIFIGAVCCCVRTTFSFSAPPMLTSTPSLAAATYSSRPESQRRSRALESTTPLGGNSRKSSDSPQAIALDATTASTEEKISQLKGQQSKRRKQRNNNNNNKGNGKGNGKGKSRSKKGNVKRKGGGRGDSRRCSVPQNKKRRVRHLYSKARSLEKRGLWREASSLLESILELEPRDAHSYLALGRLESRRERGNGIGRRKGDAAVAVPAEDEENDDDGAQREGRRRDARRVFRTGTERCPRSVHLWHAWAMHERSLGDVPRARELLDRALEIDPWNGYVCHAYGLMEMQAASAGEGSVEASKEGEEKARRLWQRGLTYQPSAALVCSLGKLYTTRGHADSARELYRTYVTKMKDERERIEVYLAASSLEETVFRDVERAADLLKEALGSNSEVQHDSRAYVALARLGTSGGLVDDSVVKKRLREICTKQLRGEGADGGRFPVRDGRLFNAWAKLESKANDHLEARRILRKGAAMYPADHALLQAAGNVEERLGNVTGAREMYGASLHLEPSAPALIAYAMLELRSPEDGGGAPNVTLARRLLNEALLIDPKHGPAYNALGNLERREGNAEGARRLYEDGIAADCTDAPSVYHGLAKLHLSLGEVEEARAVLRRGLELFDAKNNNGNNHNAYSRRNENVAFLAHTLAMIELNVNNDAVQARKVLKRGLWHCRNSPQLLLAMGMCESKLGNEDKARVMFERSLTADQRHAQTWQAFGVMEMRAGNFRTAKTLFECGLKNSPTHGALWQAYGTLESWKGNIGEARLLFAAGIQKCPKHVPLYQGWACLELRAGDVITAKRLIGEALTRDKRNGSGWLVAAKIEEKTGQNGLVGLILRRGIECAPGDVELYRELAEHEINRGKIDSARELLEKGIEINPLYAPLYHSLAELEARVFNIEGLARLNKRTAEIFPSDAMAPPPHPSTEKRMEAWGTKIRQGSARIPDGIAALAEKIGVEYSDTTNAMSDIAGGSLEDVDPESLLNSMCGFGSDGGDGLMMFQDMPDVGR